jgi:lathosterol oxidase
MFERDMKMSEGRWKKEIEKVDELIEEIEGSDNRTYTDSAPSMKKTE